MNVVVGILSIKGGIMNKKARNGNNHFKGVIKMIKMIKITTALFDLLSSKDDNILDYVVPIVLDESVMNTVLEFKVNDLADESNSFGDLTNSIFTLMVKQNTLSKTDVCKFVLTRVLDVLESGGGFCSENRIREDFIYPLMESGIEIHFQQFIDWYIKTIDPDKISISSEPLV